MPGKKKDEKESLATYRRIVWYDEKLQQVHIQM